MGLWSADTVRLWICVDLEPDVRSPGSRGLIGIGEILCEPEIGGLWSSKLYDPTGMDLLDLLLNIVHLLIHIDGDLLLRGTREGALAGGGGIVEELRQLLCQRHLCSTLPYLFAFGSRCVYIAGHL
jgi:hypothetical protein